MAQSLPTIEQITALPHVGTFTVTEDHLDIMGHMNVRHYLSFFDDAGWELFNHIGLTADYYRANKTGGFALQQIINYIAEVRLGETVHIHARILGRTEKRIHNMLFMVNINTGKLAATIEEMGAHADLTIRRTAPYPPHIAEKIDALLTVHQKLAWDAPLSGVMHT
ncbi:MAG: thioesterase family protein [Aggregatilineales bacterium]